MGKQWILQISIFLLGLTSSTNQAFGLKYIMNENSKPTSEELQEEEVALKESKVEEIRASVITKYELDEADDSELIDKISKDIIAQQKSFGKVVSQKRDWRERVLNPKKIEDKKDLTADEIKKQAEDAVEERFMKRDLDDMDVSDELKDEVKKLAKMKSLTIRQAFKDPYIIFLSDKEAQVKKLDKSSISVKKNGKPTVIDSDTKLDPEEFDLRTPEGRKSWDEAKKAKHK